MSENEVTNSEESQDGKDGFTFVKAPSFKVDYKGECVYEVGVSIPVENIQKQSEELYAELKGDAEVPGFRRGKAPLKLLKNKFGKAIKGEAAQKLVSAAFEKLVKDEKLRPLDMPEVEGLEDLDELNADAPLDFTLKFEVSPRCELGTYRGIEVERPVLAVGEKQLKDALAQMQERFSTFEVVDSKAKSQDGDQIVIDFKGTIDDVPFDGGTAENYPYVLGSKRFLPEFEAALGGVKSGKEITAKVPFPENYSHKALAGKTAEFAITIHEIKRKKTPALDDDFAKTAGYESLEDMNAKVLEHLKSGAVEQSNRIVESRAISKVIENSTFEVPASLIDSSAKVIFEQEVRRLMQMRVPAPQIEEAMPGIQAHATEEATRNIKAMVVLNEIAEAEGIEVTEEDFEKEAEAIGTRTGMDMAIVQKFLLQGDKRSEYENNIFYKKAGAVILDNAKITDKEVTQEELEKEDAEVSEDADA